MHVCVYVCESEIQVTRQELSFCFNKNIYKLKTMNKKKRKAKRQQRNSFFPFSSFLCVSVI